jgi:hypothetical protein
VEYGIDYRGVHINLDRESEVGLDDVEEVFSGKVFVQSSER